MKFPKLLLGAGIIGLAAPANAAISFHDNIVSWRSGAAGGQSSHAPAAERVYDFSDLPTGNGVAPAVVNGTHTAVASGAPYTDLDLTLTVTPNNPTISVRTQNDWVSDATTGVKGVQVSTTGAASDYVDVVDIAIPGGSALSGTAFAITLHDLFDTGMSATRSSQVEIYVNGVLSFDTGPNIPHSGSNGGQAVDSTGIVNGVFTPGSNNFPAIEFGDDDAISTDGTFIGFTASPGSLITSVQIRKIQNGSSGGDNWGFDNIILVPEPSRAVLLGIGLIGILLRRQR